MFYLNSLLILAGVVILIYALFVAIKIRKQLPKSKLKNRWFCLTLLIVLFITGYIYTGFTVSSALHPQQMLISLILFSGSIFVITVCKLTLKTIKDVKRILILEEENTRDPLMGIYNKRYFNRRFNDEFERAVVKNSPLSLLMVDVDDFKEVNDTYGHDAGDLVLVKIAEILQDISRGKDFAARFGGEEIIMALPDTNGEGAKILAERIRIQIFNNLIIQMEELGKKDISGISVSIGIASTTLGLISPDNLVHRADKALYKAKELGRNRVEIEEEIA